MPRKHYSVSQLSVDLGVDRRTLDKRLDGVKHVSEGARKSKLYFLKDVWAAMLFAAEADFKSRPAPSSLPADKEGRADELASARLRREIADAELAEIKVSKERGDLVEADRIERLWGQMAVSMRAKMLSLPSRAALQTAGMESKDVERAIEAMVREALEELAGDSDTEELEEEEADAIADAN